MPEQSVVLINVYNITFLAVELIEVSRQHMGNNTEKAKYAILLGIVTYQCANCLMPLTLHE